MEQSVSIYSQSIIFKFLYTIVSQELNQKKMEKKKYIKPILESEVFIPQEYVASCYDYDALFYCEKGKKGQDGHGAPCATTTVEVRGAQAQGWETGNKTGNSISNIDLNGFNLNEELSIGTVIPSVKWISVDPNGTGTYYHSGSRKITSKITQIIGRPNHS